MHQLQTRLREQIIPGLNSMKHSSHHSYSILNSARSNPGACHCHLHRLSIQRSLDHIPLRAIKDVRLDDLPWISGKVLHGLLDGEALLLTRIWPGQTVNSSAEKDCQ